MDGSAAGRYIQFGLGLINSAARTQVYMYDPMVNFLGPAEICESRHLVKE